MVNLWKTFGLFVDVGRMEEKRQSEGGFFSGRMRGIKDLYPFLSFSFLWPFILLLILYLLIVYCYVPFDFTFFHSFLREFNKHPIILGSWLAGYLILNKVIFYNLRVGIVVVLPENLKPCLIYRKFGLNFFYNFSKFNALLFILRIFGKFFQREGAYVDTLFICLKVRPSVTSITS